MKTYVSRGVIGGMLHAVCTVAYTIFLFQRKIANFDFHTLLDYLVTKMTKKAYKSNFYHNFQMKKHSIPFT